MEALQSVSFLFRLGQKSNSNYAIIFRMQTKKIVVGNWKMNPATQKQANQLALSILRGVNKLRTKNVEVVICPPFSFLEEVNKKLSRNVKLGAQDIFFEILKKGKDKIFPLKDFATVGVGFVSGANEFFYLEEKYQSGQYDLLPL